MDVLHTKQGLHALGTHIAAVISTSFFVIYAFTTLTTHLHYVLYHQMELRGLYFSIVFA